MDTLFKATNTSGYESELRVKESMTEDHIMLMLDDPSNFAIIHLTRKQQLDLARALING